LLRRKRFGMIVSFTEGEEGGVDEVVSSAKLGMWCGFGEWTVCK
jgi:hypothetical protein